MYIPSQYIPVNTNKAKPVARKAVTFDKAESEADSAKQAVFGQVMRYDQREGQDRRQRDIKPLLDTRTGQDRRLEARKKRIDVSA
jgi:hypothetical protein